MKNLAVILLIIVFFLCLVFLLVCGGMLLQHRVFGRNLHYHPFFMGLLLLPWAILSNMSRGKLGLLKRNFKGRPVMAAYGLDLFGYIVIVAALKTIFQPAAASGHVVMSYVAAMGGMWALGMIDDIHGDRSSKGMRGHFRELLLHGKLTTGAVKAIGGLVLGFVLGLAVSNGDPVVIISSVLLIPLSANAINLMDLRPGRACGVF